MFKQLAQLIGGAKDPTAEWSEHVKQDLVYDLRTRDLNGLALAAPLDAARSFGKCDDYTSMSEFADLCYRDSGLALGFASGALMQVTLVVSKGGAVAKEHQLEACTPSLVDLQGARFVVSESTTVEDLTRHLGPPVESGPVGGEMMHSFILQGNFIDACHDLKTGGLRSIEITEAEGS